MKNNTRDQQLTGMAGEFLTVGKLFKRGYQASVTLGNAKAVDVLVYNPETGKSFNVQVKTLRKSNCFPLKKENIKQDHIYIFIILHDFDKPEEFFILRGKEILNNINNFYGVKTPFEKNSAKKIAQKIFGKITILIAGEFLSGSIHVWQNQQHEIAKNFGCYFLIPELNHHLLEGLSCPQSNPQNLICLMIKSKLYRIEIQKRFEITKEVLLKNKIEVIEYECNGKNEFLQAFETIHFGSYVNFYLSILNEKDPTSIPWVDYFKLRLKNEKR